jgi:cell growth-regulating nucleolar protein
VGQNGTAPRNNYPPQTQEPSFRQGGGGRSSFRPGWGPARYQATGANGTPLGTPARMSPATQEPPEPATPQQAPVTSVIKSDVVAQVTAEQPLVEKKEKKDKKEKREKKRKSDAIDDQTVRCIHAISLLCY